MQEVTLVDIRAQPDIEPRPCLRCRGVSKTFGGVKALQNVSFDIHEGGVTSLIGPNGAGKTTLFNYITGFLPGGQGEVWFKSERIDGWRPHAIARSGLVRTFQSIRMFAGLTVLESVLVAQYGAGGAHGIRPLLRKVGWLTGRETGVIEAEETLEWLGLIDQRNKICTDLPLLAQRKLEVARAIACRPTLLLLDEPSAGATITESQELMHVVQRLAGAGTTIVVIEHNVPFVMALSNEIWVLNFGEVVAHGTPLEIRNNAIVQEIYLGA